LVKHVPRRNRQRKLIRSKHWNGEALVHIAVAGLLRLLAWRHSQWFFTTVRLAVAFGRRLMAE
jgi:hypothetical protein